MSDLIPFLPGFAAAYAILLVAASSPGPAVATLLGIGVSRGRGAAMVATAGIATGSILLNLATMAGVSLLLTQAAWAMSLLRLLGSAYLAWLAIGAFRRAINPPAVAAGAAPAGSRFRLFSVGFLLQVTNPKAVAFWLAIAAVGATEGGGASVVGLFVLGAFLISFACHGAWALLLSSTPFRVAYGRARRGIEAALGVLFMGFALRMATERS